MTHLCTISPGLQPFCPSNGRSEKFCPVGYTPKALHSGAPGEAPLATGARLLPGQSLPPHLVGLRGAGAHNLHVFGGEVVILQQVVQQTLSVADVSDQKFTVAFQQLNVGVKRLCGDYFHLTVALLLHG